jgi:hypothetical protein
MTHDKLGVPELCVVDSTRFYFKVSKNSGTSDSLEYTHALGVYHELPVCIYSMYEEGIFLNEI